MTTQVCVCVVSRWGAVRVGRSRRRAVILPGGRVFDCPRRLHGLPGSSLVLRGGHDRPAFSLCGGFRSVQRPTASHPSANHATGSHMGAVVWRRFTPLYPHCGRCAESVCFLSMRCHFRLQSSVCGSHRTAAQYELESTLEVAMTSPCSAAKSLLGSELPPTVPSLPAGPGPLSALVPCPHYFV
jgi:hypothetical protein